MPNISVNYEVAHRNALESFKRVDPAVAAGNTDVTYQVTTTGNGQFIVPYFKSDFAVEFPHGVIWEARSGSEPPLLTRILILHYLTNSTGKQLTGEWVNFRQLPDGLMYQAAFRAQEIQPIIRAYGQNLDGFISAGERAGGERARLGDASFLFRVFPRVPMLLTFWVGDDELPASADILFDSSIPHYLSLEDIDAVGRDLSARMVGQ